MRLGRRATRQRQQSVCVRLLMSVLLSFFSLGANASSFPDAPRMSNGAAQRDSARIAGPGDFWGAIAEKIDRSRRGVSRKARDSSRCQLVQGESPAGPFRGVFASLSSTAVQATVAPRRRRATGAPKDSARMPRSSDCKGWQKFTAALVSRYAGERRGGPDCREG